MPLVLADRVKDTTTTTGTGTVTLSGTPPTGFQAFSVIGNGNTTYYTIVAGSQWEVGIGTYTASGTTLSRDTVLDSSSGGSLVNFSAGTKEVFVTYPADKSALTQVGQIVVASEPPPTGTWLETGSYYSKATYSSLATVVGNVPDIGAPVVEPQAQLPVAFSTLSATNGARYVTATDGTTTVLGGNSGAIRKTIDGVNWTPVIGPFNGNIREMRYLNGNFIGCINGSGGSNGTVIVYSSDGSNWTTSYVGLPTSTGVRPSVAYGSGRYVVSASGVASYSTDLVNWTRAATNPIPSFNCLIFANSLFVGVGSSACGTSSDGITWTTRTIPAGTYTDVIYANGLYVAYGISGILSTSPDGVTWTSRSAGSNTHQQIIYANSLFVAVATNGAIYTSADGVTWTLRTSGTTLTLLSVVWNGTNFVAGGSVGQYLTSVDGITWTVNVDASLATFNQIEVVSGKTVGFGTSASVVLAGATRSVPFLNGAWSYTTSATSATNPRCIAYNGSDLYVVGGDNGAILTSPNGNTWTGRDSKITGSINSVFYLNGNYLAIGPSGSTTNLITSPDGVTWTRRTAGNSTFNAAAYGASTYVVVTVSGGGGAYYSTDLVTWTAATHPGGDNYFDVVFGNSLFVSVGSNGALYTSPTGVTWTVRSAGSTQFNRIIYDNGLFVAVGNSGTIRTSVDGITWTAQTSNVAGNLNDVVWNGSIFCAVGASGVITTSPDGTTWTARTPGDTSVTLMSVAWSGTRFIVTNLTNTGAWTSTDGITWTRVFEAAPSGATRRTSYLGGKFISVGTTNFIQTSTDGLTWRASDEVQYVPLSVSRIQKLGGVYYALTSNGVFQSSDGVAFSAVRQLPAASTAIGVTYSGSAWVIVCNTRSSPLPAAAFKSTDGTTWAKSADLFYPTSLSSASFTLTDCEYASGNFVFGASLANAASTSINGGVYTSPDGVTWTPRLLPFGLQAASSTIASDGTTLVTISNNNYIRSGDGGLTWTLLSPGSTSPGYASGAWILGNYVTDDLNKQVFLSSGVQRSASFYVHGSKYVYTMTSGANVRIMSQIGSLPDFTYTVPMGRLAFGAAQTNKELPTRSTTLLYPNGGAASAAVPFFIAECPLYSYDTATTFWVPPQAAGGGQIAYIYAGP